MWSALVLLSVIGCAVAVPPVSRSRADIESFKSFLEKSRRDDGVLLDSRMLANPKASPWENSGKFEGDILLNEEQAEAMLSQYAAGRNAYIVPNTRWPGNTILYEWSNDFNQGQLNAIVAGMNDIQARTCIRFRQRESWEHAFVRITGRQDGCYANVGYWANMGVHTYNLAGGCFSHTTIVHEWLHVIGFMHMQSTYNRYDYVRVLWENMISGMEHNFHRYENNVVSNLGLPYEYASTMHYGRYGFSRNGQPTLLPIHNDNGQMGQTSWISGWDWHRANRHYNCPGAWSDEINVEESSQGVNVQENLNVVEDLPQEDVVVEQLPQEDVVVADMPQEEIVAGEVSFVDDAPQ